MSVLKDLADCIDENGDFVLEQTVSAGDDLDFTLYIEACPNAVSVEIAPMDGDIDDILAVRVGLGALPDKAAPVYAMAELENCLDGTLVRMYHLNQGILLTPHPHDKLVLEPRVLANGQTCYVVRSEYVPEEPEPQEGGAINHTTGDFHDPIPNRPSRTGA